MYKLLVLTLLYIPLISSDAYISAEDLVSRTDLEIETVEDLLNILSSEFED